MEPPTVCTILTDMGRVRETNEDALLARPDAGLFAVADGMGGHRAGEVASAMAVEVLERLVTHGPEAQEDGEDVTGFTGERLCEALVEAGRLIAREGREVAERRGMGTTATALLLPANTGRWTVGHVGDSRAYLLRDGRLERLTRDHNLFPGSSTLTRALGAGEEPRPDLHEGTVAAGDLFLLCTDGLTDQVADVRITEILRECAATSGAEAERGGGAAQRVRTALERAARTLVEEANAAGGRDNVTVALVGVVG